MTSARPLRVVAFPAPRVSARVVIDAHWRYVEVNDQAVEELGEPRSALLGADVWEVFPEARGTPIAALMRDVMLSRVPGSIRTQCRRVSSRDAICACVPDDRGGIVVVFHFEARDGRGLDSQMAASG